MVEWSDVRLFLAAARGGGTHAAARTVGIAQTTVARRIGALERALGLQLFDRTATGYRLSEAGALLMPHAEQAERAIQSLADRAAQQRRTVSGTVRITSSEAVANLALTPWLSGFMDLHPGIRVELIVSETRLDLLRGEADVALRAARGIEEPGLVCRKIAEGPWAIYCSLGYAQRHGCPSAPHLLVEYSIVGADGDLAQLHPHRWLAEHAGKAACRTVSTNLMNALTAVKAGHGLTPLPCGVGDGDPDLVRCFRLPSFGYGYYLAFPEALKQAPRIRAVVDYLAERAAQERSLLEGLPD